MFALWKVFGEWRIVGPFKDRKTLTTELEAQKLNPTEVFILEASALKSGGKFPPNPVHPEAA
jgi:hypothetical protein